MKKFVLILFIACLLVFIVSFVAFAQNIIKVGIDPSGTVSILSSSNTVDMGTSFAWESLEPMSDTMSAGFGMEFQLYRKAKGATAGFSYMPLYTLVRFNMQNGENNNGIRPYLTGKIGYDLFLPETLSRGVYSAGGLYYAVGGGAVFSETCEIEALYSWYNGSVYDYYSSIPFDYSKLGISVGFVF